MAIFTLGTKPKTVDGVMEVFNTTITDLEAVAAANEATAKEQDYIINVASGVKVVAEKEAKRALDIAGKLKGLFA